MPKKLGLTVSEYAKHRGCSRQTIYVALRDGRLVAPAVHPDGSIDARLGDLQLDAATRTKVDGAGKATGSDGEAEDYHLARARKEAAAADLAELRRDQQRGLLIEVEHVRRQWFGFGRSLRDALLGLPDRLAPQLAPLADEHAVRVRLDHEIREVLIGLAGDGDVVPGLPGQVEDDRAPAE